MEGRPAASEMGDRKPCSGGHATWLDGVPLGRGDGPRNGVTLTVWSSLTIDSEVFVGRYTTEVWTRGQYDSRGHLEFLDQTDNTRLIERLPPPKSGPPGWIPIQPGQCVWGEVKPLDQEGTVARFLVDLPAQTVIDAGCFVDEGEHVPTEWLLTLEGKEAERVPIRHTVDDSWGHTYKTDRAGRYSIVVRRTDAPDKWVVDTERPPRFSFMMTWGFSAGSWSCHSPRYESKCQGGEDEQQ
jgi:hypothetical protein